MPRYLVIGSGGREHAIAWKLAQEKDATVFVAPGSHGIATTPNVAAVPIAPSAHGELADFARREDIDLTIVGPEAPLVAGLADYFRDAGLTILGPGADAAMLEGSKAFAKEIMEAAGVPTARYRAFDELTDAIAHVEQAPHPCVIKADGLAGGKGVVISEDTASSVETLNDFMADRRFGDASGRVVIEEFLRGPELSFMVITDGTEVVSLSTSRDHKRLLDGDAGPNTGGMGAITPSPNATDDLTASILHTIVHPVLAEVRARGLGYRGFLYVGLMLTESGPKVLEFNVRLGDPETQALMVAMEAELGPVLLAAARGELTEGSLATSRTACCIVLAAAGYPLAPRSGDPIGPIPIAEASIVFHAGTSFDGGEYRTAGGRVLGVTAAGPDASSARAAAYGAAEKITWPGRQMRHDIGT